MLKNKNKTIAPLGWRKCKKGMIRQVDFALGIATVRLLSSFVYGPTSDRPSSVLRENSGGRVYFVEDINTGRRDCVGIEFLRKIK